MAEQAGPKWLGGAAAKAMTSTAVFLKEQGRIQEVKPDYSAFITDPYHQEGHGQISLQPSHHTSHWVAPFF